MLPELDDEFALDAAGFDTLEELRDDVRARLLEADERAVEREFREAVLDAAAAAATVTVPEQLIEARAKEAWERRVARAVAPGRQQGDVPALSGMSEEEILAAARRAPSGRCARRR